VDGLLQLLGFGLGATVYVILALALIGALRRGASLAVALYWSRRERSEARAAVQRVYDIQREAPVPRRRAA
jgi:hypothetical protein